MALINGLLQLGTGLSGNAVVVPSSGAGYAAMPCSFDLSEGSIAVNVVNCVYGPVSGSWGTLTSFGVTDLAGNPVWAGTLQAPLTPANGALVLTPLGLIQLAPAAQIAISPASNWAALAPVLSGSTLAGNPAPVLGMVGAIGVGAGLALTSGGGSGVIAVSGALTAVSGAKGGNVALANLITALAAAKFITDMTT